MFVVSSSELAMLLRTDFFVSRWFVKFRQNTLLISRKISVSEIGERQLAAFADLSTGKLGQLIHDFVRRLGTSLPVHSRAFPRELESIPVPKASTWRRKIG
jgi:hypothetical protein